MRPEQAAFLKSCDSSKPIIAQPNKIVFIPTGRFIF